MPLSNINSPGVYIDEINAFPNSIVPVATAVPAFIGYTPQASYEGKSYLNKAQKITSFNEFKAIYCLPDPPAPTSPSQQYSPQYYFEKVSEQPENAEYIIIGNDYYVIVPDPNSIYYLYNSVKLFYENGGGEAYIVSVGTYGSESNKPINIKDQIVNSNVKLNDLLNGLELLKKEQEPTMYICPEATLLSIDNNGTLMQEMLLQCSQMQTAISVFDVIGGRNPDPHLYAEDIETFRINTGLRGLSYGAAYYPFIGTTIMQSDDLDYINFFGGDIKQLKSFIAKAEVNNPTLDKLFASFNASNSEMTKAQLNNALLNLSKTYSQMMKLALSESNLLPPSGGMAGVMATNDSNKGVWNAPANTSIVGACSLPIHISSSQQADLNVDAVSGKSINAIRSFSGMGILIWGARSLDGNSQDWRYVNVRRTMTFIEQSCRAAISSYVFQPNDANTWKATKSMIENFLTTIWKEGGLQGGSASDAFYVACGLGSTMTSDDILNGIMRVSIKVAVVHPAEFIVLTLEQEMAKS